MKNLPAGFLLLAVLVNGVPAQATAATGQTALSPPSPDHVEMTAELLQRLIKFIRTGELNGKISGKIAEVFGWSKGTAVLDVYLASSERPPGSYLAMRPDLKATDILILHKTAENTIEAYLTDASGKLRAAAIDDGQPHAHLILNEQAAEKFEILMAQFAREAAEDLPPTSPETP